MGEETKAEEDKVWHQLRNAIKYDVLFVIAYFNIPENIIQIIILHSLVY